MDAIHSIRTQIEVALDNGMQAAGLVDNPENRRAVLESTIENLEKDSENSSSITEKMWIRRFIFEAKALLEEL
jgi:hypothetical protein